MTDGEASARRPRRRRWPWVLLVVLVALVLAVVYGGDAIARPIAQQTVAQKMGEALGVDPSELDVSFSSTPLPIQLLDGRLDSVDVRAPHLTLGPISADTTVHAAGVPLDPDAPTTTLRIRVAIDRAQLATLAKAFGGGYVRSVTLDAPDVRATGVVVVFGATVPIGVAFEPAAAGGRITLTPTAFEVAGAQVTADQLRQGPLRSLAAGLLERQTICVADHLPKALTLTSVRVRGDELVAAGSGDGAALGELGTKGTC